MMHQDESLKPDYLVKEGPPEQWTGKERRGIDGITLQLMAEVRSVMERHEKIEDTVLTDIRNNVHNNRLANEGRHEEVLGKFTQLQSTTLEALQANSATVNEIHKMFKEAFPAGDVQAHRKAHEHWMQKEKDDREFWLKLKQDVLKWVVVAVLGWGGIVIWAAFLKGPGA